MMRHAHVTAAVISLASRFIRNRRASSAVEFAIVAAPFFFLLMGVTQVGIFYMAQSALDTGVIKTAEVLRSNFVAAPAPALWNASQLKSNIASSGGAFINNDTNLLVEIRQLTSLTGAAVPIVDGVADFGATTSTLVLRAQATVVTLAPGLGGLNKIYSSALVRRQGT